MSVKHPQRAAAAEETAKTALLAFEEKLETAWVSYQEADYRQTMGREGADLAAARAALLQVYNDPGVLSQFELLQRQGAALSAETKRVLGRWVEELRRTIIPTPALQRLYLEIEALTDQLNEVRKHFVTEVVDPQGQPRRLLFNQTREILWKHPDRAYRERVFRARAEMGRRLVGAGLPRLIQMRNRLAREMAKVLGRQDWASYNYYRLKYEQFGLEEKELFALFTRLRRASDARLSGVLEKARSRFGWSSVEPWDFDFVLASAAGENPLDRLLPAQAAEATALAALTNLGFPMRDFGFHLDLYPRPGKGDNAACFTIRAPRLEEGEKRFVPGDIRLYANLGQGGFEELSTLFHELGHAVHHAQTRQSWWLDRNLERPAGTDYTLMEIASTLFEKLIPRRDFLAAYAQTAEGGRPASQEIERRLAEYRRQEADRYLLEWRQILARVEFDRALYRSEGKDPAAVWSRAMEENLLVAPAPEIEAWIERPHFVSHPVYYQAYLLAQMGSSQIMAHLEKTFPTLLPNPAVGPFLTDHYFVHGHRFDFRRLIEEMCGEPFSEKALLARSGIAGD